VAAGLTGLAFDTKMLQAFLVLPAFIVVYLIAGPPRLGKRLLQLSAAAATLVLSAGWWVAIVALWPAASRPYIGSTTNNSIISLIFGYNGLSRIFGGSGSGPSGTATGGGPNFGGVAGLGRMFNSVVGGQISWLIPLALAGLITGLWLTRRGGRADRGRAGWLLWGLWGVGCLGTFSLAKGIFHPYYTVQLAPAIAALAGAGSVGLWELGRRHRAAMAWALPAAVAGTAARHRRLVGGPARSHAHLPAVAQDRGAGRRPPRCRRGVAGLPPPPVALAHGGGRGRSGFPAGRPCRLCGDDHQPGQRRGQRIGWPGGDGCGRHCWGRAVRWPSCGHGTSRARRGGGTCCGKRLGDR